MKKGFLLLLFVVISTAVARAQADSTASHIVTLILEDVIDMTFTSANPDVTIQLGSVSEYASGKIQAGTTELVVRATKDFKVYVEPITTHFQNGSGSTTMPASVLQLKATPLVLNMSANPLFSSFSSLPTTSTEVISNSENGDQRKFEVQYKADPKFDYPGGTYNLVVEYTATQL